MAILGCHFLNLAFPASSFVLAGTLLAILGLFSTDNDLSFPIVPGGFLCK
jgi:hypothetical protein